MARTYNDGDYIGTWENTQKFRIRTGRGLIFLTYTTDNWQGTEIIRAADNIWQQDNWLPEEFFQSGYVPYLAKEAQLRKVYWEGGYDLNGRFNEGGTNIAGRLPVTGQLISIPAPVTPNPPSPSPTPSPGTNPGPTVYPPGNGANQLESVFTTADGEVNWWIVGGAVGGVLVVVIILALIL